ncbi:MAG: basic secretory family protein [Verrucomicrobiae bacterium]|nr:basic secretory family protein [Verrucomicrobiae bacterium]
MNTRVLGTAALLFLGSWASSGEIRVQVEHRANHEADATWAFRGIPPASTNDAATFAAFSVVAGTPDDNSGGLDKLHDGRLPADEDQPEANFFFAAGTAGGRIVIDLGRATEVKEINTYSWHPSTRAPQVYSLWASDGEATNFTTQVASNIDPQTCGWKLLAKVDTRAKAGPGGGQYGVSVSSAEGALGRFRYVLLDIQRTESEDPFGNTFYSEVDVVSVDAGFVANPPAASPKPPPFRIRSADGCCEIVVDSSDAPDLREWAEQTLAPVLAEWFPKVVAMLPSEGYVAPTNFTVVLRPGRGVAATSGRRITANADWVRRELKGEAVGALLHEMVHVIQQYGRSPRGSTRPPGWLVEGITDYIRWFKFEPQSHGADIVWLRKQRNPNLRYDASYRITANFLNWVAEKYDPEIVRHLNAAIREGKYSEAVWKEFTGKTADELGAEWKAEIEQALKAGG